MKRDRTHTFPIELSLRGTMSEIRWQIHWWAALKHLNQQNRSSRHRIFLLKDPIKRTTIRFAICVVRIRVSARMVTPTPTPPPLWNIPNKDNSEEITFSDSQLLVTRTFIMFALKISYLSIFNLYYIPFTHRYLFSSYGRSSWMYESQFQAAERCMRWSVEEAPSYLRQAISYLQINFSLDEGDNYSNTQRCPTLQLGRYV